MDKYLSKIKEKVKSSNQSKKVKIVLRSYSENRYAINLEMSKDGKKHREYIKKYICGTKETETIDNEILRYIFAYRDEKERELLLEDTGFHLKKPALRKTSFLDYFEKQMHTRQGTTYNKWLTVFRHLLAFTNNNCRIEEVNEKFCRDFYEYLNSFGNNSTPKIYFKVFSTVLNHLFLQEIITINPAKKILLHPDIKNKLQNNKYKKKEFLSIEEIKLLFDNPIDNKQVMNAFLFSCFTGLRFEDIKALKFSNIKEEYLYIRQLKTEEDSRMKLTETAQKILDEQKDLQTKPLNYVFTLSDNKVTNKYIKRWIQKAGIDKHITFHCARHSFATICLTHNIDLYSVSKLLGHKDISTTQIYAKLVDKKKDEAIDKFPNL